MTEIKPTELRVTLYQGDDMAKVQAAFEAAEAAEQAALQIEMGRKGVSARVGDGAETKPDRAEVLRLSAEYDALVEEAKPRAVSVLMRAVGRKKWREMVREAQPPREGDKGDEALGFDQEKLSDLLVPECMAEPSFKLRADQEAFLDSLSDAQFGHLYDAAYAVNRGSVPDPKADMSSMLSRIYGETSESPERLG